MSCEMISSRKIDYYVNDPYVTIIDIRLKEKYVYSRIKGAIHYEYNKLVDDINNIYQMRKRFHMNLDKYLVIRKKYTYFIAIKVRMSLDYMRERCLGSDIDARQL